MIIAKYRMMTRGKNFYSVGEDPKFAVCSACGQKISRGEANTRTYSIGSVIGIGRYLLVYRIIGISVKAHIGPSLMNFTGNGSDKLLSKLYMYV